MENKIYSRKETATKFQVTTATLLNWEKNGFIDPPARIGRRVFWTDEQIKNTLTRSSSANHAIK